MNKELQDLNTKAKRTYGLIDIFTIKAEFKNEKEEKDYINKLNEFLFSSKFKYIRGGKIMSYRKSDYSKEYYYPINRTEWQQIQKLIKKRNKKVIKKRNKKRNIRFFNKFKINRKLITFNYQLKTILHALKRKTK